MATLADVIESYLKRLLAQADGTLDVSRSNLADHFECVPSQINYVLKTRFNVERGYVVESRRGGGGYIRIIQVEPVIKESVFAWINDKVGRRISKEDFTHLLIRVKEAGWLDDQDVVLIRHIVNRETEGLEPPWSDVIRASVLRALLLTHLRRE